LAKGNALSGSAAAGLMATAVMLRQVSASFACVTSRTTASFQFPER